MRRTFTLALPDLQPLTSNQRLHWAERNRRTQAWREAAGWAAKEARVPRLERAHVVLIACPPDRRRRDPHNYTPVLKAAVDGIVDAQVLPDDSTEYLPVSYVQFIETLGPMWIWRLRIAEMPSNGSEVAG